MTKDQLSKLKEETEANLKLVRRAEGIQEKISAHYHKIQKMLTVINSQDQEIIVTAAKTTTFYLNEMGTDALRKLFMLEKERSELEIEKLDKEFSEL